MESDAGHEVGADYFLMLYGSADKKFPGDFRREMHDILGNDIKYTAEKKVIEVTEQIAIKSKIPATTIQKPQISDKQIFQPVSKRHNNKKNNNKFNHKLQFNK